MHFRLTLRGQLWVVELFLPLSLCPVSIHSVQLPSSCLPICWASLSPLTPTVFLLYLPFRVFLLLFKRLILWPVSSWHGVRSLKSSKVIITDKVPVRVEHTFSQGRVYNNMWVNQIIKAGLTSTNEIKTAQRQSMKEGPWGGCRVKEYFSEEATAKWRLEG